MLKTVLVTAGMIAVGWMVWRVLQRQEGDGPDGDG